MSGARRAIVLGSGSSGGVPRPGGENGEGEWGACDPANPKNRRTRCSLLIEQARAPDAFGERNAVTSFLIDCSPDMREQLLAARCARIDAVAFTHDHADQSHGTDDLRVFAIRERARVPVWLDRATAGDLLVRFSYCFEQAEGSWYPPILEERTMPPAGRAFAVDGPGGALEATPFLQDHGPVDSLGFRIGDLAYSSDVVDLSDESFEILRGVKTWIVDALQMTPHGSHAHFDKTLEWIDRVRPDRAILTNLHVAMDYETVRGLCPPGVEPAYDGLVVGF